MIQDVRYEVRYIPNCGTAGPFAEPTIIRCARVGEAIDTARDLARDDSNGMVEAWQIGAPGGDPAIATGLLWSRGLAADGIADPA